METTCISCQRVSESGDTVGGVCQPCLYGAGLTPATTTTSRTSSTQTAWSDAFPQFDASCSLQERPGFTATLGTLASDEAPGGSCPTVLVVWERGSRFSDREVGDALLARIGALRRAGRIPGLGEIVDAGDLSDAIYLVAQVPPGAQPLLKQTGSTADAGLSLPMVLPALGEIVASVQTECGVTLDLDPAFVLFSRSDLLDGDEPPHENSLCLVPVPRSARATTTARQAPAETRLAPGKRLGPYLLESDVGEGGFGEVWCARQERPAPRRVALKILKHGLSSPRMQARFEAEQGALARLDHPNVARFFAGGTTPDGRPYFAMEWIDGSTITTFCRRANLPIEDRLALFREVCQGIQHAHQKGILHRDIKASNVMVASSGGTKTRQSSSSVPGSSADKPTVKIIDFGIAKALEDPLTDETLMLTQADEVVGTPATMSPEQAAAAGRADLDARTDVYGLGVLLYELLTGILPFDPSLPRDELRDRIRDDDPPRPSARIDDATAARRLRGELDWIAMRCLEKEPGRRYESVSALLHDLDQYAGDKPVSAGPPEFSYRCRKFIKRHRVGLALAGAASAALIAGAVAIVFGLLTAKHERATAIAALKTAQNEAATSEAVNTFLTDELLALKQGDGLAVSDPRNHDIQLRTVLERAAARIEGRFEEQPEVEASLRRAIAASFLATGDFEKAGGHAERAVALFEEVLGERDSRTLDAILLLASIRASEGKPEAAQNLVDRIASITGEQAGDIPQTLSASESAIIRADLLYQQGKPVAAASAYASALDSNRLSPRLAARALSGTARAVECCQTRPSVLAAHRKAVSVAEDSLGKDDALTLDIVRSYARFLGDLDVATYEELDQFATLMQGVVARQTELLGRDHPDTLRTRFDYNVANGALEVLAPGALRELEAIVAAAKTHYPDDHPEILRFQLGLATQFSRGGQHERAVETLETVIEGGIRSGGEAHPVVVDATRQLGEACRELGRDDEAMSHFRTAVTRARSRLSPAAIARQDAVVALSEHLWSQDDDLGVAEAIEFSHNEYRACSALLGPEHRLSAGYVDRTLATVSHDRTGGLALAAAARAMQVGGTPAPTIRALLQLSLASQLCLRPSLFDQTSPPLPEAFFRLLQVEAMPDTGTSKTPLPPELVGNNAEWRFIALGEGDAAPAGWETGSFDDRNWRAGAAPLGCATEGIATDLRAGREPRPSIASTCVRRRIVVPPNSEAAPALLRLRCTDGAVVYLNGHEVIRFNLPDGALDDNTQAITPTEPRTREYLIPAGHLVGGLNLLAARLFQSTAPESNLHFSAVLHAPVPSPLQQLANFDPAPAIDHLDKWLPGLAELLEDTWREQAECMQLALLGQWDEALTQSEKLVSASSVAMARLRWFRRSALERLGRDDESVARFHGAIPPRDPSATPELIDLTDYYNALTTEPWHVTTDGSVFEPFLKNLTLGIEIFDGVTFDARGLIQLSSEGLESLATVRTFPDVVEGIPIGRPVGKLHFLNATFLPDAKDNVVARAFMHYTDGTMNQFPIRYMRETLNYMVGTDAPPPDVRSGWRGPDPYRPGIGKELFIATWTNPRPSLAVSSIELRAESGANAALFIAGMTIEPPQ